MRMEIKWYEIKKVGNLYQLTIEGTMTPLDIFNIVKEVIEYDQILITSYDMEKSDFNPISEELKKHGIDNEILPDGVSVYKGWINCIFEYTDFGKTQDSYTLIPSNRIEFEDYKISVDYRDIPDLKVIGKSKSYLELIFDHLLMKIKDGAK